MIQPTTDQILLTLNLGIGLSMLIVSVLGNDAEFGRIITFDNFDHFKVSN